jgi:hypothetical protein
MFTHCLSFAVKNRSVTHRLSVSEFLSNFSLIVSQEVMNVHETEIYKQALSLKNFGFKQKHVDFR